MKAFEEIKNIVSEDKALAWLQGICPLLKNEAEKNLYKNSNFPAAALMEILSKAQQATPFGALSIKYVNEVNDALREIYRRMYHVQEITCMSTGVLWAAMFEFDWDVERLLSEAFVSKSKRFLFPPLLLDENFVGKEVEAKAPLFYLHFGTWLQTNKDFLLARAKRWSEAIDSKYMSSLNLTPIPTAAFDDEIPRIIINDCRRTFLCPKYQFRLATFLHSLWKECNNYSQSMSYLAAILLLVLNEQQAACIMRKVNAEYIPGHWAAQAVGFNTNAYVWQELLANVDPSLHKHFVTIKFFPDTYLQKIFSALCIHVLEFDVLFEFLEAFLLDGFPFLLRFALSLAQHFREKLLQIGPGNIEKGFDMMKMDGGTVMRSDHLAVLDMAKSMSIDAYLSSISTWRANAYEKIIKPRLANASSTSILEPCNLCETNDGDLFCEECGPLCSSCNRRSNIEGKLASHSGNFLHEDTHLVEKW